MYVSATVTTEELESRMYFGSSLQQSRATLSEAVSMVAKPNSLSLALHNSWYTSIGSSDSTCEYVITWCSVDEFVNVERNWEGK